MSESTELTVLKHMPIEQLKDQVNSIQILMRDIMRDGEHYGIIPGCGKKPSLFKAGAEKLGFSFRLSPAFKIQETNLVNGHKEFSVICSITHIDSGKFIAEGVGYASTMESKYRYRESKRVCPACGNESISKGKDEFGGGWYCNKKIGGCGAKFQDGDREIENQTLGKSENTDIADVYNTVLKMAKKRAHVDAMITATAASDIFTQDIEDEKPEPVQLIKAETKNKSSVKQSVSDKNIVLSKEISVSDKNIVLSKEIGDYMASGYITKEGIQEIIKKVNGEIVQFMKLTDDKAQKVYDEVVKIVDEKIGDVRENIFDAESEDALRKE